MKVIKRLLMEANGLIRKIIFSRRIFIRMIFGVDVVTSPNVQSYCEWGTILIRIIMKQYIRPGIRLLEIGTGAHATLAIFAKKNFPDVSVLATDILAERISSAKKTAAKNGVDIEFAVSDMFEQIEGRYELIIFNPPAIPSHELEELGFKPRYYPDLGSRRCWSSDGGIDGLDVIRTFLNGISKHLTRGGQVIIAVNPIHCSTDEMHQLCQQSGLKFKHIHHFLRISNAYVLIGRKS
jgi:methylase of polypeptide subunit release factors